MKRSFIPGLLIVLLGGGLLLNNLGLLHLEAYARYLWPCVTIVLGLCIAFANRRLDFFSLALMVGGTYWLLVRMHVLHRVGFSIWGPCLLVLLGLTMLFPRRDRVPPHAASDGGQDRRHSEREADAARPTDATTQRDGVVRSSIYFGSENRRVDGPCFTALYATTVFGATKIDLCGFDGAAALCPVNISCIFGGFDLYIPRSWRVERRGMTCALGGLSLKGTPDADANSVLVLDGLVAFGGIDIHYI